MVSSGHDMAIACTHDLTVLLTAYKGLHKTGPINSLLYREGLMKPCSALRNCD